MESGAKEEGRGAVWFGADGGLQRSKRRSKWRSKKGSTRSCVDDASDTDEVIGARGGGCGASVRLRLEP
jgi:hypothetical protein